tara:strand:+ start:37 stop:762 length:726 start_codon:yes stop_codon:yes gene_type:complete
MDKEVKDLAQQIMKNAPKEAPHRKVETEGQLAFGPYVPLCKVHQSLVTGLLNRGDKLNKGDKNNTLAGHLQDQRGYTYEDKKWFIKEFEPYVKWYIHGALKWSQQTFNPQQHTESFTLIDLWINYMKEHEYNPEHNHGGQLSWVIFLDTPDLKEEQKSFQGTSSPPGSIVFSYGEAQNPKWAEHTFRYDPQPGYMWMFPAQLRHQVMPFHTPGKRISVSGNLFLIKPGSPNTISEKFDGHI